VNEDKSRKYHRLRRRASVSSVFVAAAALTGFLWSGLSIAVRDAAAVVGGGPASVSTVALYIVVLVLLGDALMFPVSWYRGFVLEQRFGLSSEPAGAWLRDHVKGLALSCALALLGAEIVYAALRWSSVWWWVAAAAAFIAGVALIAALAPVLLMPVFYKFTPLSREDLHERIIALSARAGVPVLGVYEWGLGEKTRRANAALVGTGRTRRVLLSDTLLAGYSDDEIEVVLAHELGHHAHHDIAKGLLLESVLIVAGFALGAVVLRKLGPAVGLTSAADVAGLPLLLLTAGAVSLAATPAINAYSRRNERAADRFALTMTRRPAAFVSALKRLATQNLAEPQPSQTTVWLFHTHPPIEERISAAQEFRSNG
jgi:Zn-dependent protease with chaperone function